MLNSTLLRQSEEHFLSFFVVNGSAAFIIRCQTKSPGQLVLEETKLPYRFQESSFLIGVCLICNVVLVCAVQRSESIIYIYIKYYFIYIIYIYVSIYLSISTLFLDSFLM